MKSKDKLRKEVLKEIYCSDNVYNSSLVKYLDLDIYFDKNTFFEKIDASYRKSLLDYDIELTREQNECLDILNNSNLFISAPTSFGKTFIAFEYIERNKKHLNNIVFVAPTIALMNEIRKKCYKYFSNKYILITNDFELERYSNSEKKIFIFVPERTNHKEFVEYINENKIDFLVYDEIYKLQHNNKGGNENVRSIIMNYVYKNLVRKSKKILLLGPFIKSVSFERSNINIQKKIFTTNLVYNEVKRVENFKQFVHSKLESKTFIYFKSPESIYNFLESDDGKLIFHNQNKFNKDMYGEVTDWIKENIHEDWYYSKYIADGIGIHHGKTPIYIRKFIEDEYSKENSGFNTILCTSTLMEGVNTPTSTLFIYDQPNGAFELNNIIGRVGRLNVYNPTVGKIYYVLEGIQHMLDSDNWLDLNIVYEQRSVITDSEEDEYLYLEKELSCDKEDSINSFFEKILQKYKIDKSNVISYGVEYDTLVNFINFIENDISSIDKEGKMINGLQTKVIPKKYMSKYIGGLKFEAYKEIEQKDENEYLNLYPVLNMIYHDGKMKYVINEFIEKYEVESIYDINTYINTLFAIDEYIKFSLSKVVNVFSLFYENGNLRGKEYVILKNAVNRIKSYFDPTNKVEKILTDLGIPKEDFVNISNFFQKHHGDKGLLGTEGVLKKIIGTDVYDKLSPFSKNVIDNL